MKIYCLVHKYNGRNKYGVFIAPTLHCKVCCRIYVDEILFDQAQRREVNG